MKSDFERFAEVKRVLTDVRAVKGADIRLFRPAAWKIVRAGGISDEDRRTLDVLEARLLALSREDAEYVLRVLEQEGCTL